MAPPPTHPTRTSGGAGDTTAQGSETWYAEAGAETLVVADAPTEGAPIWGDRYVVVGRLGSGGMGEVWRVRDQLLSRVVAMKLVSPAAGDVLRSRFFQEAQATAQLEHPSIVPIYDYGELEGGVLYYTMQVVHGRTLGELLGEVHAASADGTWRDGRSGASFRRLIASFLAVCEGVAYAHARGVIHRDLKPANVMLGAFGQTLVVDWGLAKILGQPAGEAPPSGGIHTARAGSPDSTSFGVIAGTPQYMPPEQARGELGTLGPTADVWSLGAILFEVLTGRPPFDAPTRAEVIAQLLTRDPPRATEISRLPLPEELVALAAACLQQDAARRPPDAGVVADEVRAWLDGQRRREQALALVERARAVEPEIADAMAEARDLDSRARALLDGIPSFRPTEDKLPGWRLQDQAEALRERAARQARDRLQLLRQAHTLVPELPEANALLADHYQALHAQAEAAGEHRRAAELEDQLRNHDTGRWAAYLSGTARLTLHTHPPGARATLHRYVVRDRRLVPEPAGDLGHTPIDGAELPVGSYRVALALPDRPAVHVPIALSRGEHADGIAPGDAAPHPIALLPAGALGPDDRYVPAGWFTFGGDPLAHAAGPPTRVWLDGFAIQAVPVTNAAYIAFLDDLVARGHGALAEQHAPRYGDDPVYHRTADGRFALGVDPDGDVWLPEHPVVCVDAASARAYAAWLAARTGLPWRLPTEIEWEKAARGVDGRIFPWGAFLDPSWTCIRGSRESARGPSPVGAFPVDCSPYDVRDLAGNVCELCGNGYRQEGPPITAGRPVAGEPRDPAEGDGFLAARGGNWNAAPVLARAATRFRVSASRRDHDQGFRLVRTV